jgi:HEAT repeat protein
VDEERIDTAIADMLRTESRRAASALAALGPDALHRVVALYYGGARSAAINRAQQGRSGRELVDAWSVTVAAAAAANPEAFLDEIRAGRVQTGDTLEIVILGRIDLPEAAALLRAHADDEEWLVRYHVVRGLGRRTDPASVEAVRAARSDSERMVRREAARWQPV